MKSKMSSEKWRSFRLGFNVLHDDWHVSILPGKSHEVGDGTRPYALHSFPAGAPFTNMDLL